MAKVNIRKFLIVLVTLAVVIGCSKGEKGVTKTDSDLLIKTIPSNALAFLHMDMQNEGMNQYIHSEHYKRYMDGLREAIVAQGNAGKGMDAYFDILGALKILPSDRHEELPYSSAVFFLVPKSQGRGVDFRVQYQVLPSKDAKELMSGIKGALTKASLPISDFNEGGINGFEIKMFDESSPPEQNPVLGIYKDLLLLRTMYVAESKNSIVAATTKELLMQGANFVETAGQKVTERTDFKKAIETIADRSSEAGYGFANIKEIANAFTDSANSANLPIDLAAFSLAMDKGSFLQSALLISQNDPTLSSAANGLAGASDASSFGRIPRGMTFAVSLDTSAILKAFENYNSLTPSSSFPMVKENLSGMKSLSFAVRESKTNPLYPDVLITAVSANGSALVEKIKGLAQLLPLPPTGWQHKDEGGLSIDWMPSPLGVGIYLGSKDDLAAVSSSEEVLKDTLLHSSPSLSEDATVSMAAKMTKNSFVGMFIDYEQFTGLFKGLMPALTSITPKDQPKVDTKQFEYMREFGKLALFAGYEPGVLHVTMRQQYPEK